MFSTLQFDSDEATLSSMAGAEARTKTTNTRTPGLQVSLSETRQSANADKCREPVTGVVYIESSVTTITHAATV